MDEELKRFVPDEKFLIVGDKKFSIWVSAERTLKATVLFNKLQEKGTKEHKSIMTDLDFYMYMLDVAFLLIRQDFKITKLIDWLKRQLLTKAYILKHMDIKELEEFINNALEPIIGTKKKDLLRQEKAAEAMMMLMDHLPADTLAQLLENSLPIADLKKTM